MTTLSLTFETSAALAKVREAVQKVSNPRPLYLAIGEALSESTRQRFVTSTAPDGSTWAPNSPVTIERYLAKYSGTYKKNGKLSARGQKRSDSKKPLIGESRALSTSINYQVDASGVSIGSGLIYAGVQQFGAKARSFGGVAPWGDIEAREFLGASTDDERTILDLARDFLATAI